MITGKKRRREKKLPTIKVKNITQLLIPKQEISEDVGPCCKYCKKSFRSSYSKVLHEDYSCLSNPQKAQKEKKVSIKKEVSDGNYKCEKCFKIFSNIYDMKRHLTIGSCQIKDEKPNISRIKNYLHSCSNCSACFNAKHNLTRHLRKHCRR